MKRTSKYILTALFLLALQTTLFSQDFVELIDKIKEPVQLSEEQEKQITELLGTYAVQLNEKMEQHENAEEADPKAKISAFKEVRDEYRDGLQGILSEEQYEKYQEVMKGIFLDMFTDIAYIKLIDLQAPLSMTDEQLEQLSPVMGKSLMGVMQVVIEYGDSRMGKITQIKVGKKLKKIKADADTETAKILTPEQIDIWNKIKEEKKAESKG